ncbi:MAG: hypothetical protein GX620_14465 [Chloroflexi bacterium]|nr:hypothetical protein [Chloroflexota bacterium]
MAHTVLIHLLNEEPILAEVAEAPQASDQVLIVSNVRRRDGREVSYILAEASKVVFPWTRIHCVELLRSEADEDVISFIRE